MNAPEVTLVVVPRERFSCAKRSLESIYRHTRTPFRLVYVDGGSPSRLRCYLGTQATSKGFQVIRSDRYLSPNQARNLGLRQVKTKYVVFIDNDVLVSPGWLEALVQCARDTDAWVVGPLYLMIQDGREVIHMAGGTLQIREEQGRRILHEQDRFPGMSLTDVPESLRRTPSELVEFHCMLLRTEVFERLGPLDEKLLAIREHDDLCLAVRKAGGAIYLEPDATVTYLPPPPISMSDRKYYMLRWSKPWIEASLQHFHRKWDLDVDSLHCHYAWLWRRRYLFFRQYTRRLRPWRDWIASMLGRHPA